MSIANPTSLEFSVVSAKGSTSRRFTVRRMVNAGYVGRDRKAVEAHIEELKREGVPPPPSVPMVFPVLSDNITTAEHIEVIGDRTSGEAEYALLLDGEDVLVGIGSDHTDRELERFDIVRSKQISKNVISTQLWLLADVRDHWDQLVMRSWVRPAGQANEVLYQQAVLGKIIGPDELIDLVKSRLIGDSNGLAIFSGTVAILTKELICGDSFRVELVDEKLDRKLSCQYDVRKLDFLR